jgi:NAD(P)-dependent dehydrogenase (short-subunit alcohol dehydrogenase family)
VVLGKFASDSPLPPVPCQSPTAFFLGISCTPRRIQTLLLYTHCNSPSRLATAHALAAKGAHLALCDITFSASSPPSLLDTLSSPAHHKAYALDVSQPSACITTIAAIATDFSRIDGLFNCAGINPTEMHLTATTDEYYDRLMDTNLRGTYVMTRAVIPHLPAHANASIVNVSSTAGIRASAGFAIYNATKFAIIGFSKSMALELGRSKGVRVNVVAPGPVDTPTNASVVEGEESVRRAGNRIALGRMGKPEEVADVVVWLFGEGARWVNGSVVEVTGGT